MLTSTLPRVLFIVLELTLLGLSSSMPGRELYTDPGAGPGSNQLHQRQGLCNEAGFALVMQNNGNLVLYDILGPQARLIWTPVVLSSDLRFLLLTVDSELILANSRGEIAWRSNYHGPINDIYRAFPTETGDFVVVNSRNQCVWHSGSHFSQLDGIIFDTTSYTTKVMFSGEWSDVQLDDQRAGCTGWSCKAFTSLQSGQT